MLKEKNMINLDEEFNYVETESLEEERVNASEIYASLDKELKYVISRIPYPNTGPYDTGVDYDDIFKIQYEKKKIDRGGKKEIV